MKPSLLPSFIAVSLLFAGQARSAGNPVTPNLITVTAPAFRSEINGDTRLSIHAPGFQDVEVKCWKQGPGFGTDSLIGTIAVDGEGNGSVVFPADKYPHGPITVRISGKEGNRTDTCHLQLFNKCGISWNEGAPREIPPPAAGMSLVFSDDFSQPLSISREGRGTVYTSHKPGGGDFGILPFSDYRSAKDPFLQVETWLRIRADANLKSAGLISSMRMDGTGIMAKAPCYFECRFLAQSVSGAWPAFWIMTTNAIKGMGEPVDELDVIEGYGGDGPKQPNMKGYMVTSHFWHQPEAKDPAKGINKHIPVTTLGGQSTIWDTFHTYGCKVTETDTIYYFDNIEVGRHPTGNISKNIPFFFFINLAVGGNGWPVDLSRYGGVSDMYVDYVRVYQGK